MRPFCLRTQSTDFTPSKFRYSIHLSFYHLHCHLIYAHIPTDCTQPRNSCVPKLLSSVTLPQLVAGIMVGRFAGGDLSYRAAVIFISKQPPAVQVGNINSFQCIHLFQLNLSLRCKAEVSLYPETTSWYSDQDVHREMSINMTADRKCRIETIYHCTAGILGQKTTHTKCPQ